MQGYVRPSVERDAYCLAPRLRQADLMEIDAASGENALQALVRGYERSYQPYTMLVEDQVIGMFGAVPTDRDSITAAVWLLSTDDLFNIRYQFLRNSHLWLDCLHKPFSVLFNYVDCRNTVHIRWLKWCNFKFIAKHDQFGVKKEPFYEFVKIK